MYQVLRQFLRKEFLPAPTNTPTSAESTAMPGYAALYESHAQADAGTDVIGVGDFEHIGRIELRLLELAGLQADMKVLDFGCGIGRLAQQLLPNLPRGHYVGVDISETMIHRAQLRIRDLLRNIGDEGQAPEVTLRCGDGGILQEFDPESFDLACAFSVFTHMDLEDTYVHLQCLHRVLRPGAILVCSHLLLPESSDAKNIFSISSAQPYSARRSKVLSVVTCREMIQTIAEMSGFRVHEWIGGSEVVRTSGQEPIGALGQAVSFLQVPKD